MYRKENDHFKGGKLLLESYYNQYFITQSVNFLNSYIVWLSLYCCTICTVSNVSLIFEIVRHIISEDTSNVTCLLHETIPLIVPYPTTHTLNISYQWLILPQSLLDIRYISCY